MQNTKVIFQMATHHLSKIALRVDFLLKTIRQASQEVYPILHRYALQNLNELLVLIQKPELKSHFLKELIRIEHRLRKIDLDIPEPLYTQLHAQIQQLNYVAGRFGEAIQTNPFLQSLQQSRTLQTKDCEETSPQLLLWLELPYQQRQEDLLFWLQSLTMLQETIGLYLALIKHSATYELITLQHGFYQCTLPPKLYCHLILLRIDKSIRIVPQMQIGHHGLSVRLLDLNTMREIRNPCADVDLAICQI